MIALSDHRNLRIGAFSTLYFAQGVPWGFIGTGYVVMLTDLGLDNVAIGAAIGLAYLPWSFKILWGPMLDAVPALRIGRRRPFIAFAELMMGVTMLALAGVDPTTSLGLASALLFLNNVFASLQDVAVDAMAVDLLREDERGTANSFMWAGKSLGVALGGGAGTVIAKHAGWGALFFGIAFVLWLIMAIPLLLRERPAAPGDRPVDASLLRLAWFLIPFVAVAGVMYGLSELEGWLGDHPAAPLVSVAQPFAAVLGALLAWPLVDRDGFRVMRASFSFSTPWWGVLASVLMPAGYALVATPTTRMLRADLKLSSEQIATLSGVVDPLAGVAGALIGGVLADRLGVRRTIGGAMFCLAGMLAVFAGTQSFWPNFTYLIVWTAVFNALVNGFNAGTLGMYMSMSNPKIGATHFAVYMAATNLTFAWTAPFGGLLADRLGMVWLYTIAAAIQVSMIVLLVPLDVRRAAAAYRT